jgi:hypothetical protein
MVNMPGSPPGIPFIWSYSGIPLPALKNSTCSPGFSRGMPEKKKGAGAAPFG